MKLNLEEKNILFFTRTMGLGGTENVIIQLCEILDGKVGKIVICSSGGVNVKYMQDMGIKHYSLPDIDNKSLKNIFKVMVTVFRIIKKEKITVVHTHHRMAAFYTKLLSYTTKFSFINTSHNTFFDKKMLTKYAYSGVKLIAVGSKVKENLCKFYNIPENQITVISNTVKPFNGKYEPVEILANYKKDGYFLVGNIGRLSEQKGMEYYIKSAAIILKKYSKVKFFIVGDGENKQLILDLISQLGLSKNVVLLGYRSDIQNVMSQLDLIVLSSLWEGLPLIPIEAFSVGKPVVATAVDGTVEIIKDNVNGLLVESRNSEALAEKIITIINNEEIRRKIEENAIMTYNQDFKYELFEKKYIDFYKKL